MVDGVLLLVGAVEGPMPQTRLSRKAPPSSFPDRGGEQGSRPGARPEWVVNQTFFFRQARRERDQLDFPVVYASALFGYARKELDHESTDMAPLFDAILKYVPVRDEDPDAPLQLQACRSTTRATSARSARPHPPRPAEGGADCCCCRTTSRQRSIRSSCSGA
jgi:GTP-binding protein